MKFQIACHHTAAAVAMTLALCTWLNSSDDCYGQKADKQPLKDFDKSEQMVNEYLERFQKTGVPTPKIVGAAFDKAKRENEVGNWLYAADVANMYGKVIDVLSEHHAAIYHGSTGTEEHFHYEINMATEYETIRNTYLGYRNYAYLQVAKLYLAKGDKAKALSYASTSVELSGSFPNVEGEKLILQIIESSEPQAKPAN